MASATQEGEGHVTGTGSLTSRDQEVPGGGGGGGGPADTASAVNDIGSRPSRASRRPQVLGAVQSLKKTMSPAGRNSSGRLKPPTTRDPQQPSPG